MQIFLFYVRNVFFSAMKYFVLLFSCRVSRYSAPIHCLVHGHMTSKNETVSRQMAWAGNIAKNMKSNGKQFTVTRELLTAVARDQSVQLKVAWRCSRNLIAFFKICFCFVLLYNKSLNHWSLGKQWILFPENLIVSRKEEKFTVPLGTSHAWSVNYVLLSQPWKNSCQFQKSSRPCLSGGEVPSRTSSCCSSHGILQDASWKRRSEKTRSRKQVGSPWATPKELL